MMTIQAPKIILPSPSPLLKESEVFMQPERVNERTCESTLIEVVGVSPLGSGSFGNYSFSAISI